MPERLIQISPSAYQYPLLLKHIWTAPLLQAGDQEVVYRDAKRFSYRDIRDRVGRLASALAAAGVQPGDTVGVMDWDSNRFLEAFFAIPMMGAVLQTVNVASFTRADRLHDRSRRRLDAARQRRFRRRFWRGSSRATEVKRLILMSDREQPETGEPALYRANTKACSRRLRRTTTFPISTRTPRRRPSIPLARPG